MNLMCVVISDKPIIHDTQATVGDYGSLIAGNGVNVYGKRITWNDGRFTFDVMPRAPERLRKPRPKSTKAPQSLRCEEVYGRRQG